jgi:predicted phage terminase large subunit-like protein
VEAGNVYLPHPAIYAWVNDYVEELTTFPNSKYKDQCDSTTMALNRLVAALVVAVVPLNIEKESKWRTG